MKPIVLATCVALAACSRSAEIVGPAGPELSAAKVPANTYVPVTAGQVDYQPVEPKPPVPAGGDRS
jgi:hypothetical protein